jgi:hypothetical protein
MMRWPEGNFLLGENSLGKGYPLKKFLSNYFCSWGEDGPDGGVAGSGTEVVWLPRITEGPPLCPRKLNPREVSMKITAAAAVNFAKNGAAPELPKTVWLDPPKAAPIPAPLPVCNKTIHMRAKQTIT